MYLLVNVLEQPEHLVAILEGFANIGIKGSTVMNSTGMGRVLMKAGADGPAMEEINRMIANGESSNKTIFTVVKEKEILDKAIDIVKSLCGDLCEPGKGILFAVPLAHVDGLPQGD
jgi:nitrogen regulatory protein P-II 1